MPPKKGKKPQLDFDFEATTATDFFSAQAEATADAPSTKKKGKKKLEFEDDDLDEMFKNTKKSTKKPSDDQPPPAPQGVVINRANLSTLSNLTTTTPTTTNGGGGDESSDDDIFASLPTTKPSTTTPRTTTTTQQQQPPRGEDMSIGEESGVQSMQQRVLELRRQQLSLAASSASPSDHPAQPHLPAAHTNALATAGTAAPSSASILGQQHKIKTTAQAHQHQTLIDAQQRQHLQHQQQLRAQQQREQYQQHHRNQINGQNEEENDEEEEEFTFIRKKDRKNIKKLQVDAPTLFTGGDGEEQTLAQLEAMNMAATAAVKDQIERDANVLTEEQRKAQEELPDDKDYFDDLYLEVTKWREREAKRLLQELNDRLQYLSLEETERDEDGNKPAAGDDSDEYYVADTDSDEGDENGEGKDKKEKILQKHGLTREDYQKKKEDRAAWKRLDADQKVVRRRKERDGQEISAHEFYAKKITKLDLHQPKNNNDRAEQKDVSYTTDDFARTNKHKHDERYSKHMSLYQEEPPKWAIRCSLLVLSVLLMSRFLKPFFYVQNNKKKRWKQQCFWWF